jgi:hypothetical protein
MSKQFFFRCTSNPNAPLLTVGTPWEAKDMRDHPDYEEVELNEVGEVLRVVERVDDLAGTIPFNGSRGRK